MDLPQRKPNRLPDYDYSTPGAYFITICIQDRKCILGRIVGASIARPPTVKLSNTAESSKAQFVKFRNTILQSH